MALGDYRVAVVTGASRGIGLATARRLAARGLEVHAVARTPGALDALAAETGCVVHALDITDAEAVETAFADIPIDILVNNAADAGGLGDVAARPAAEVDRVLRTNIAGVVNCLRAVLPGMRTRNRGHVVNLGSVAGQYAAPGPPLYAATKAALHSLGRNLRLELAGSDIRLSEISPGRVETGIHVRMVGGDPEEAAKVVYGGYDCLQPEDIAEAILFVLDAPARMDVTLMEILPTRQVYGGTAFHKAEE